MNKITLLLIVTLLLLAGCSTTEIALTSVSSTAEPALVVFELSEVDEKPVAITLAMPVFPRKLKEKKTSGRVLMEFIVGVDGSAKEVRCIKASDHGFIESAINAILETQFRPGLLSGENVSTRVRMPIYFIAEQTR